MRKNAGLKTSEVDGSPNTLFFLQKKKCVVRGCDRLAHVSHS
jgi:hypothetical protein